MKKIIILLFFIYKYRVLLNKKLTSETKLHNMAPIIVALAFSVLLKHSMKMIRRCKNVTLKFVKHVLKEKLVYFNAILLALRGFLHLRINHFSK
jgi:hypothetical protein